MAPIGLFRTVECFNGKCWKGQPPLCGATGKVEEMEYPRYFSIFRRVEGLSSGD
jgi:hypothetical protein